MTTFRTRSFARPGTLGLMASASILSMFMAGQAHAACTVSSSNPLNNVTTNNDYIDCNGANTGQTISINADAVQVQVNNAGDTLDNSTVTITGANNTFTVQNGGTTSNLDYSSQGTGNELRFISGPSTNVSANIFGSGSNFEVRSTATVTLTPGGLTIAANPLGFNSVNIQGTLTATGNNGGNYLINAGTGDQYFNIQGTLTVQPNGLAISAGDGQDEIDIGSAGVVNGGTGNNIMFDGGAGYDRLVLSGGGSSAYTGANIEQLFVIPGAGNTRVLGGSGDYEYVLLQGGTVQVADVAALGQSNSQVQITSNGKLQLTPAAAMTFGQSLFGNGQIEQLGQTITYNGTNSGFSGNFLVTGGTALINSSSQFGTGTITNSAAVQLTNVTLNNTINGTGTVTMVGGGTGTLGGNNSYSGGTFVNSGTLRLTNAAASGSGTVTVAGSGNLELDFPTDQTYANAITGAGGLIKSGAGTATLTGTNSYSGGTTINAGAIRVDDFARLGTGPVTANSGASLILDYNGAGQLLQTTPFLTGAGSFIKEGSGDVVMNQTSTYTGGTIIRAGRIGLNNGDALGTGNIQVDAGAELGIGGIVLNNTITGTGLVRKTAPNIAELYGDNSGFTGVMRVEQGTVFAANGSAFGAGTLQIDTGNTAELNAVGDSVVAADLAGGGVFEKYGSGIGTLSGDGTAFSGTVSITGGALRIEGTQNIGGATVLIGSAGTLMLETPNFTVFNNTVLGAGNVIKTGTGTVFVTTTLGHTGGTDIQQGALRVTDVSFLGSGPISVQGGAVLDLSISGSQSLNQTISGAGILRKSDQGDLTLLSNSLTGGLDIVGGRVIISSAGAIGGGPVTMAADTQLVFDTNTTQVMANPIGGAGTLTKEGSGLLVIQNANTFTGGTLINNGRIGLNNGQGLGTGGVILLSGAELAVGGVSVANAISGAGRVFKTSNNVGTLTGVNSYSGGTEIQDGTLAVNSPAALGSGGVLIGAGTTLLVNYNGSTNAAMANVLSGAGSLVKDGNGTVVINTGGNSYTGGTTINAGRLGLNFGDGLGTGAVQINAGAELAIGNITLANVLTGGGRVIKTSTGNSDLTGANTFSGGIDLQGGSITVTSVGALGTGTIGIAGGSSLIINNATGQSFVNAVTGSGSLVKQGAGQLTFTNPFTAGSLAVNGGRVRLNTVATTNATVAAGATLDGTGRVIGNLTNNGTVAPGNSIGTLAVQGNYTHNAGSVLEIEFDGNGGIDLLSVTGTATLNGGTLRFISTNGNEGSGGTFLTANGGVTGTFATVETVGAQLPLAVIYQPTAGIMAPSVLTARPSTFNAQSLAAADTALGFMDSLRAGSLGVPSGKRIWMTGFGAWGDRSASGSTLAYDHDTRGISGGITFDAGDRLSAGVALGWAKGDIALGADGGGGDQSSVLGTLHLNYSGEGFTLGGGVLLGKVQQSTLRNVTFGTLNASVSGETSSTIYGGFAEVGVPLGSTGNWTFSATGRASYVHQAQEGYTESGTSPLRLTLGDLGTDTVEGQVRLTAKTRLWAPQGQSADMPGGLDLRVDLGGRFLGTLGTREIPVTFAASSAGVVLQGDMRDSAIGQTGLALDYTLDNGATFSLGYRGDYGTSQRHAVQAGFSFRF